MALTTPDLVRLAAERQAVLDDLNLAMLFIDSARVDPSSDPDGTDKTDVAREAELTDDDPRRVRLRLVTHSPLSPADTAALLCRILHNLRIASLRITRMTEGLHLTCQYRLPGGVWTLEIRASLP